MQNEYEHKNVRLFTKPKKKVTGINIDAFIAALKDEFNTRNINKRYPQVPKINLIFLWILNNQKLLKDLSPSNPVRFEKKGRSLPITIQIKVDHIGKKIHLEFNVNSKVSDEIGAVVKLPEVKAGYRLYKQVGSGMQKVVNKGYSYDYETKSIKRIAISVATDDPTKPGTLAVDAMQIEQKFYQPHNPFLVPTLYGAIYIRNGKRKMSASAPLLDGHFLVFLRNMDYYKPDMGDIAWIAYAFAKGLELMHADDIFWRDCKAENVIFTSNEHGIVVYLNDFGLALRQSKASEMKIHGGSALYIPFDSPIFNELINLHNQLLQENSSDQLKEKYIQCMKEYAEMHDQQFRLQANIIYSKNNIIPIQKFADNKSDIWGMCLLLRNTIYQFCEFMGYSEEQGNIPKFLITLNEICKKNLYAAHKKRMSAIMLVAAIKTAIEEEPGVKAKVEAQSLLHPVGKISDAKKSAPPPKSPHFSYSVAKQEGQNTPTEPLPLGFGN